MDSFKNSSPDNTTTENVDASINQSPDNVGMVKNIDIVNKAETNTVSKTPDEIAQDKIDNEKAVELSSEGIKLSMIIKEKIDEIEKNATPENIARVLSTPEKAKSFMAKISTSCNVLQKFGEGLLDKVDEAVEAAKAKIVELYKKYQTDKATNNTYAFMAASFGVALAGGLKMVQFDTEYLTPAQQVEMTQGLLTFIAGMSATVSPVVIGAIKERFFKRSKIDKTQKANA